MWAVEISSPTHIICGLWKMVKKNSPAVIQFVFGRIWSLYERSEYYVRMDIRRQTIFSHFSVISLAISLLLSFLFSLCQFYMHLSIINFILSCKCVCVLCSIYSQLGYCSFYNDMRNVKRKLMAHGEWTTTN